MQYLYLIKCQQFYKIGIANDVENRLAQLSTGNPFELEVLAAYSFENASAVETVLHQKFSATRKRGEWFELSSINISEFNSICRLLDGILEMDEGIAPVANEEELEEAEAFAEPEPGAKWDFAAMFADGWRIEKSTSRGKNGVYWCWRKGGENLGRKYLYGGLISDLPHPICDMRKIYRDGAADGNMPVSRKDEE